MSRLRYTATGPPNAPPVLLLHGFMGSSADWAEIAEALGPRAHCLAADLPGHGASTRLLAAAYTMRGAADGLAAVLDAEGLDRCDVVGYSMGGRAALYFALHHPARCRRLVLVSASPGLRTAAARAARRAADAERAAHLRADFDAFLDDWHRLPLFASVRRHAGLAEKRRAAQRRSDPGELARALAGMGTGQQPSLWERLPHLRAEALALAGALDAKYVRLAEAMAAAAPALRAEVIPEAGHVLHAERPAAFAQRLRRFLGLG